MTSDGLKRLAKLKVNFIISPYVPEQYTYTLTHAQRMKSLKPWIDKKTVPVTLILCTESGDIIVSKKTHEKLLDIIFESGDNKSIS